MLSTLTFAATCMQTPHLPGWERPSPGWSLMRTGRVGSVGDSRVYRVRDDGSLEQVSVDDRIAPDLADALGLIPNTLTACLGGHSKPSGFRPHVGTVSPPKPSRWLLCSDGLTDAIDDDAIRACIEQDDEISVARLLDAALAAGGFDNVSIVLATFDPSAGAPP